jgi:hypothetical protein
MDAVSEPSTTPSRPPHVTFACAIVLVGSVFVVLQMWDRISTLRTIDTRTTLSAFLASSRLGDLGVGVAQLTTTVQVASMAAAACATALAILTWHVTRRSHGARLAMTLLAGPLFLTGLLSDWFLESIAATFWCSGVAAAVVTLWLGPARLWFAGLPVPPPGQDRARQASTQVRRVPPTSDAPAPPPSHEQPPPMQHAWPPAGPAAWAPPPTSAYDPTSRRRSGGTRPPALLWACILTWLCTSFAAVLLVGSIVTLAQNSQPVLDAAYRQNPSLTDQGFSQHTLLVMLYALIGLVLAGSVAAAVFAAVLYRGHRWGWYALLVAAAVSTLFFLMSSLGSPIGLVPVAASVATLACLVRPEVRAWLIRR